MIAFTARTTKRDVTATVIYLLASIGFFASGTIAFMIDVCWSRKVSTGRYTTHRRWNFVITILFMVGVILDIVAFSFWSKGGTGVPEERRIQWIVSHCWLLAAIISLVVIFVESKGAFKLAEDKWDLLGNLSFLTEAILQCVARYVTLPGDPMVSVSEVNMEIAAATFWTLTGASFLIGNCLRFRKFPNQTCDNQQTNSSTAADACE